MVKPKKYLGQHFLKEESIARRIAEALTLKSQETKVLEIGPGTGVLTKYLLERDCKLTVIDLDLESIEYLRKHYEENQMRILFGDFLKTDLNDLFEGNYSVIGNFPYNISSQIFFRIWEERDRVDEVVCMLQKEVAERIASPPGSKVYGILSVLMQAFYHIEYLFTVKPGSFIPPPKVQSGVIRLTKKSEFVLGCDPDRFKVVVKQGFQNRRKTLRNALKPLNLPATALKSPLLDLRAEQLDIPAFVELTKLSETGGTSNQV